ncbi:MAG: FAD-dependent oxidoreductase, partial [Microlunatus sp.]|nr:FAD-dependent oxidoreductase [Microlunatus sp.]
EDWGGGRSGHSSTLVHGGLVDLSRIGVRAVAALRRERDLLLDRTAPHLVRRVPLLVPLTHGLPERLAVGAGLALYDAAAYSIRQPGVLPGHRQLARRAVRRLAPSVAITDVTGAVQLYEAQVDDARLTVTVVRTAAAYGALVRSRTPVRGLLVEHDRVVGVEVEDPAGGRMPLRARAVVLAAGASTSALLPGHATAQAAAGGRIESIHLVVPRGRIRSSTGLVLRSGEHVVYVVPWGRHWIVGSTAAWSEPDRLLSDLNRHLEVPLGLDAVESSFSTPARWGSDGDRSPAVAVPVPALVTVHGGGLAGYRAEAERAIDLAVAQIGGLHPPSTTRRVPLLGADGFEARWNQRHLLAERAAVPVLRMEHLLRRYGSDVDSLISALEERPQLAAPLPGAEDYLAAEVWFAVAYEGATHLDDVLQRRTRIAIETRDGGAEATGAVAELMAADLDWDDQERSRQISRYLNP